MSDSIVPTFTSLLIFQSKQKLPNKQTIQKKPPAVEDDVEAAEKFKVELQWCVQQIEVAMQKTSLKESMHEHYKLVTIVEIWMLYSYV